MHSFSTITIYRIILGLSCLQNWIQTFNCYIPVHTYEAQNQEPPPAGYGIKTFKTSGSAVHHCSHSSQESQLGSRLISKFGHLVFLESLTNLKKWSFFPPKHSVICVNNNKRNIPKNEQTQIVEACYVCKVMCLREEALDERSWGEVRFRSLKGILFNVVYTKLKSQAIVDQHQSSRVDRYHSSTAEPRLTSVSQLVRRHRRNLPFFRGLTLGRIQPLAFVQSLQVVFFFCCISIAFKRWLHSTP